MSSIYRGHATSRAASSTNGGACLHRNSKAITHARQVDLPSLARAGDGAGYDLHDHACRPAQHDQEALRGQKVDARADMGGNEQAAGRAGHREPDTFQHMGKSSDTGPHDTTCSPQSYLSPFSQAVKPVAAATRAAARERMGYRTPKLVAPN